MTGPRRQPRALRFLLAALLLPAGLATVPPSAAASAAAASADDRDLAEGATSVAAGDRLLDAPAHGLRALRELGDDLRLAARRSGMRADELRALLRTDRTAWVDPDGRVYFVDPAHPDRTGAAPALAEVSPVAPLSETFTLHSNPGSTRKLLLDVDGATVSGSVWNTMDGLPDGTHPAWDPAGDGAGFSDDERAMVQEVWAMVAEDYAPFGVDVTTEDPGAAGMVRSSQSDTSYGARVLITPSPVAHQILCPLACGGVAYLGVYDAVNSQAQPAWVFPPALMDQPKAVAEAATHEAGHNLGLEHDGVGDGKAGNGYYAGHGIWAPIMGVGYDRPLVQWSAGSYVGASNREDDLALITAYLGRRADEAPGTWSAAVPPPAGEALITTRDDVDAYRLGTCTANSLVEVAPAALAPDLDVRLALYDASGVLRSSSQPTAGFGDGTTASGLGATLTLPETGPGWVITVDGVGQGTWSSNGYDDYASLGAYTVSAPGCDGLEETGVPGPPTDVRASVGGTDSLTLSWSPPADPGDGPVTGYVVSRWGTAVTQALAADARSHTFTGLSAGATYQLSVHAVNATGRGPAVSVSATTQTPPRPPAPDAPASVTAVAGDRTATVVWTVPGSHGLPITQYTVTVLVDGQPSRVLGLGGATTSTTVTGLTNGTAYSFTVRAASASGAGATSAPSNTVVPAAAVVTPPVVLPPPPLPPAPVPYVSAPDRMDAPRVAVRGRRVVVRWIGAMTHGSAVRAYVLDVGPDERVRDRTVPAGARTLVLKRLKRGRYRIRIAAVTAAGTSPYSVWVRFRVR